MEGVSYDQYYLIFDQMENSVLQQYYTSHQPFTQCGAGFSPLYINNYTQNLPLAKLFEVIIHFDQTEASELK